MLGRKPNFDSGTTLLRNGTSARSYLFVARSLPGWSSLDLGWTYLPPSIMSVHGYMVGFNPDMVRILSKQLGLRTKYHQILSFVGQVEVTQLL